MPRGRKTGDGAGRPVPSDLPPAERREIAYAAALRLLAVRERSAAELRSRLSDKGFDRETVVFVLDRLQTAGLQDDARFAHGYAESAVRSKGVAARVVQAELRRKGVDKEIAATAATRAPEAEAATARAVAQRRLLRLTGYPPAVQARRLIAFLQRRGYGNDLARAVVGSLVAEAAGDD